MELIICEGGDFSEEKSPPSRSLPKRRGWITGDSGGEAASLREAASPPRPLSPEERLAFGACVSAELVPPVRGCVVPYKLCESTAADRAAADMQRWEGEPLRPLRGHLPFQGRLFEGTAYAARSRRLTEPPQTCGAGEREPLRPLCGHLPFQGRLFEGTAYAARSRRLCQPP